MWALTNARHDKFRPELVNLANVTTIYIERGQTRFRLIAQTVAGGAIILAEEIEDQAEHTLVCYNALMDAVRQNLDYVDLSAL